MVLEAIFSYHFERVDIAIFFTLLLLEGVLSFDNAAILAAMVRRLPVEQRRKALLYGLAGAYVFRTAAILGVAFIIRNPWLKVLGGIYLVYLFVKHVVEAWKHEEHAADAPKFVQKSLFGLSAFWSVVVLVELADIAFALDQVLVAVALTDKLPIIIVASLIAILFLRISAYYVGRLMDWFPQLETLAYVAVGFVGFKLIIAEIFHYASYCGPAYFCDEVSGKFEFPKAISIGITLTVIVLPLVVKALHDLVTRKRAA